MQSAHWRSKDRESPAAETPPVEAADSLTSMDRRVLSRRFFSRKHLIAAAAIAVVLMAAVYAYVRFGMSRTLTVEANRLQIATVNRGPFTEFIPVVGRIEPQDAVSVGAVDGGQVAEKFVEEGAMVKTGQPLLRLNNTNLHLEIIAREAQISEQLNRLAITKLQFEQNRLTHARDLTDTRFQLGQATDQLARIDALSASGAISRKDMEEQRREVDRLKSMERDLVAARDMDGELQAKQMKELSRAVDKLNENLKLARNSLDNLVIKAPIDGQLTSLSAQLGESKQSGERIGQIDNLSSLKVTAWIDEHYLSRVAIGQTALVDISGGTHSLRLEKVYPEVRDRQFRVDLSFESAKPESLRRGQSLQVRLLLSTATEELLVANGAFYDDTAGRWAFVVDSSGVARRKEIRLGRRNTDAIEVLGGLSQGDRVVVSSYDRLLEFKELQIKR